MGLCGSKTGARQAQYEDYDFSVEPTVSAPRPPRIAALAHQPRNALQVVETEASCVRIASNEIDLLSVNKYRIGKVLGTGSFGTVFQVRGVRSNVQR